MKGLFLILAICVLSNTIFAWNRVQLSAEIKSRISDLVDEYYSKGEKENHYFKKEIFIKIEALTPNENPSTENLEKLPSHFSKIKKSFEAIQKGEESNLLRRAKGFEFGDNYKRNIYNAYNLYCLLASYGENVGDSFMALSRLYKSALDKNTIAEFFMGVFFYDWENEDMDNDRAFYWFKRAADKNYARALFGLAQCWDKGIGTNIDYFVAFMLMRKAEAIFVLEENKPISKMFSNPFVDRLHNQTWLTMRFLQFIKDTDFKDKFKIYEKIAQDNIYITAEIGFFYSSGIYLKKDMEKAVALFEKAALGGHKTAPYVLGLCYLLGDGVKKDEKKALEYFEIADANGYPTIDYARCYIEGWGTEKDDKKALEILTRVFNNDEYLANLILESYKDGVLKKLPISPFVWIGQDYYKLESDYKYF